MLSSVGQASSCVQDMRLASIVRARCTARRSTLSIAFGWEAGLASPFASGETSRLAIPLSTTVSIAQHNAWLLNRLGSRATSRETGQAQPLLGGRDVSAARRHSAICARLANWLCTLKCVNLLSE